MNVFDAGLMFTPCSWCFLSDTRGTLCSDLIGLIAELNKLPGVLAVSGKTVSWCCWLMKVHSGGGWKLMEPQRLIYDNINTERRGGWYCQTALDRRPETGSWWWWWWWWPACGFSVYVWNIPTYLWHIFKRSGCLCVKTFWKHLWKWGSIIKTFFSQKHTFFFFLKIIHFSYILYIS